MNLQVIWIHALLSLLLVSVGTHGQTTGSPQCIDTGCKSYYDGDARCVYVLHGNWTQIGLEYHLHTPHLDGQCRGTEGENCCRCFRTRTITTPTTTSTTTTTTSTTSPPSCTDVHGYCRAAFNGSGSCIDVRQGELAEIDIYQEPLDGKCGVGSEKCCECFKIIPRGTSTTTTTTTTSTNTKTTTTKTTSSTTTTTTTTSSLDYEVVKLKAVSTWQSSTHRFYHARYCIDGSSVKQCTYCLCHTRRGVSTYPWIVVDFGKTVHVERVVFDDYGTGFLGQLRMLNSRPSPNGGYLLEDGQLFAKIDKPTTTNRWEAGGDGKFVAGRYLVVQQRFQGNPDAVSFIEITAFGYV